MRPTRAQMFMSMARAASTRSTCYRLSVGAVVTSHDRVLAVGYNGAPSREDHCTGQGCQYFQPTGCHVIHAEANAFSRVHGWGSTQELYVTHSPCGSCVDLKQMTLVSRVVFEVKYRDSEPIFRLISRGVSVYQLLPSGLVIDQATDQLCELR